MQPAELADYNITLKSPKDWAEGECVEITGYRSKHSVKMADGTTKKIPYTVVAYVPSPEDLAAMNAGRAVYIKQVGEAFHPVAVWTQNEAGEINP